MKNYDFQITDLKVIPHSYSVMIQFTDNTTSQQIELELERDIATTLLSQLQSILMVH